MLTLLISSCQDDEFSVGDIIAPTNIEITVSYLDNGTESPAPGLGSGFVQFSATADNATAYHFVIQEQKKLQQSGSVNHTFTTLGSNTYSVTVIAYGTGGNSSSKTIEVDVLALYEPPADLISGYCASKKRMSMDEPQQITKIMGPVGIHTRLSEYR